MTIGDRFVLREMIGSGGMGKVYRADQLGVGRTVAVKIMHPHLVNDDTAVARFTNEARATSQLNHPHSIGVIDFGQTETGVLYIVMEFLAGRPLDIMLRQEYPIPFGQIAYIACQAMEAVHAAHKLHIVHRDLKPENIFLLQRKTGLDFVKVLDFGIAKMIDSEDRSVTTPGLVPGTPEYMSPEQARGEKLDPRSDVYSLGVILYELLTNTVPFRGKSAIATMMSHVQDPPELPSSRSPKRNIPAALEAIVLWALAKDPADRIESAEHFRDVLSAWARVAGVWPKDTPDVRASSPDVLLDFFSEDQLVQFSEEVVNDKTETAPEVVSVAMPQAAKTLIGRREELGKLEQFVEMRGPRVMRLFGETGVGKSRLVKEMLSIAHATNLAVLHLRPESELASEVLAFAHEIARFCLGIDDEDEPVGAELLLTAASKIDYDADNIPGLRELFALSSHISQLEPPNRKRERATAFRELVFAQARRQPTLLVLENLDRYDEASIELIMSLITKPSGDLALLITHGPDDRHLWPPHVEPLELWPLSAGESLELFDSLFDEQTVDKVDLAPANGNPLFIEQLAHAVHHDHFTATPDKLVDLIAGRLDASGEAERRVLQLMAVIGSPVTIPELQLIVGDKLTVTEELLGSLIDRGLARRVDERFTFFHNLVGAVTYSSIPSEVRRKVHDQVAEVIFDYADDAEIAHHAYHADNGPVAIEALERAGGWAAQCLDAQGAILCYTRALELVRREWGRGRMAHEDLDRIAVELARNPGASGCAER